MIKTILVSLWILCLLLLASCSVQEKEPNNSAVVDLSAADHGGRVTVNKGDTIQVQLEGNITTGYAWEPVDLNTSQLELLGEPEYINKTNLKGGGGIFVFRFKALQPGLSQLHLIYYRSFEKEEKPEKEFEVTLDIKE